MRVTVALKGSLADPRTAKATAGEVDLPDGADAAALLTTCGLDRRGCIVIVNGAVAPAGTPLHDGDRIQIYPAQAGG